MDPVWDTHAHDYSLGTYYDYYERYGICTVLRAGRIAGYYKEKDRLAGRSRKKKTELNTVYHA